MDPMGPILDRMGLTNPTPILDPKGPTQNRKNQKKIADLAFGSEVMNKREVLLSNELTQIKPRGPNQH